MYKYVLTYILRVGVWMRDVSMRVLAERKERGEHESKSCMMWRLLHGKISEAPR